MNYENVISIELEHTCVSVTIRKWESLMEKSVKADGLKIRRLIKKHLPDLYQELGLNFSNPYESQCVRTKTHLIYVHSSIEYFIKF